MVDFHGRPTVPATAGSSGGARGGGLHAVAAEPA